MDLVEVHEDIYASSDTSCKRSQRKCNRFQLLRPPLPYAVLGANIQHAMLMVVDNDC